MCGSLQSFVISKIREPQTLATLLKKQARYKKRFSLEEAFLVIRLDLL